MTDKHDDENGLLTEKNKEFLTSVAPLIIQTITIIATVIVLFMNNINKLDGAISDQAETKAAIQDIRNAVLTKGEAADQFNFINEENKRQDQDIRDIKDDIKTLERTR